MVASQVADEIRYPDGRVSLADAGEIADSRYANGDLAPLPVERRTWTTYNYAALWLGFYGGLLGAVAGALLAVGGAWSSPGNGPFPADGLIPALKPLYDYNWVMGFATALILYWGLTVFSASRRQESARAV